jgi:hypothetical protein
MENLDTLLAKSAQEWSEDDILQLIEGLREQRARWNQEQSTGTRTRVPAKKVELKEPKKDLAFEGLKL